MARRIQTLVLVSSFLPVFAMAAESAAVTVPLNQALPEIKAFFDTPNYSHASLSPDNLGMAAVIHSDSPEQCVALVSLAEADKEALKLLTCVPDGDITELEWVGSESLVFNVSERKHHENFAHGALFLIEKDGSGLRPLISGNWRFKQEPTGTHIKSHILPAEYRFVGVDRGKPDSILVEKMDFNTRENSLQATEPFSLKVRTQALRALSSGAPEYVTDWVLDRDGTPRIASRQRDGKTEFFILQKTTRQWEPLFGWTVADSKDKEILPAFLDYDGTLYVRAYHGQDTFGIYRFNLDRKVIEGDRLFNIKGFDFSGHALFDLKARRLIGFRYRGETEATYWLDPAMDHLQKALDERWPSTINTISCLSCLTDHRVLVTRRSEKLPGLSVVYDREHDKPLGRQYWARAGIDPKQMGRRTFDHFTARDGLSIPVYVTLPPTGTGPFPAIVYVHGGPWVRGTSLEWSPIPQFLATRGYAVIEPEFRSSVGYGWNLFQAGWGQWGLHMQEDLADAARWAVTKQIADGSRIGIGGASYGGYATLMGLVQNPELFKVGFEWVGVTDIQLMYTTFWSDMSNEQRTYGMPLLIGDPVKRAAQFEDTSPVKRAAAVHQPLLMAYGLDDRRVPLIHGTAFHDAISKTNSDIQWKVYPDEGHGWHLLETNLDFWGRVEKLLDRTLKAKPSTAAAASSAGSQ